ncbi:MAG: hypothetical protein LBV43_05480 [Prevotella sp.]|jgi:hypothetical protein|nr:hypothetical protein [Prevotella sp.]
MRKNVILFLCGLLLFSNVSSYPQVTIGADIEPNKGSLLDIKQLGSENKATATKGLMLPRVNLSDLTKLYPMLENDEEYKNNINGKQDEQNKVHTGLTVYNVGGDQCRMPYLVSGVYTWDGAEWVPLSYNQSSGVLSFKDQDGNSFKAYTFGEAGT